MIGFGKPVEFNRFQRAGAGWQGCLEVFIYLIDIKVFLSILYGDWPRFEIVLWWLEKRLGVDLGYPVVQSGLEGDKAALTERQWFKIDNLCPLN